MTQATYEFEVVKTDDGWFVAIPYDFEGGTQGEDFDDLCEMAADWLRCEVEHRDMHDIPLPPATFGNEPRHGGKNMVFSVQAGRETVSKVSASEAARLLGVTPGRVSQMLASNLLEGWRDGRNTYVTLNSVNAHLAEEVRPGRRARTAPGA